MQITENEAESISKRRLTVHESAALFFEYNFRCSIDIRSAHPRC